MKPSDIKHGLITYAFEKSYLRAIIPFPPPADFVLPKENTAVAVFENVLNKVIFPSDLYPDVLVNSQVPPHMHSSLRADLAISYTTRTFDLQILCFIEAKRTNKNEYYNTATVEVEALDYCQELFRRSFRYL